MIEYVTVISLDRTPERLKRFRELNPHVPVQTFSAVDGRALDRRCLVDEGIVTSNNRYPDGALGLLASHVALWRRCADLGQPLHVAEDDTIFRRDFMSASSRALDGLREWDIVLWGWNFDWPLKLRLASGLGSAILHGNQPELRDEWRAFADVATPPILARVDSAAGTTCYSISPAGADKLLTKSLPVAGLAAPFAADPSVQWVNLGVDVELSRHYPTMAAFVALPPLVAALNDVANSTIRSSDRGVSPA